MRMRCRAAASLPPAYRSCSRESGSPGLLMRPHVAPRRVLDRLELALARHARARRRHRFGIARLEPVDPIGPPASLRLGRAVDELAQRVADREEGQLVARLGRLATDRKSTRLNYR